MPADERFVTRPFRDGDEVAILELFAKSFPHAPRTREHFDWKFRRDPFGNERISLTFEVTGNGSQVIDADSTCHPSPVTRDPEQRLVGHYAAYAVPFYDRGEALLANQIGDTMTDVAVRHVGRGPTAILGRAALHFYETFCQGKGAFNYGFNVATSHRFSLKFLRSARAEAVPYRVCARPRPIWRFSRWPRGYQL